MPGAFSKEKVAAVEDPYEDLFANYERKDAIRYKKTVRALTKKDGVFMKLARKQFDQSNATKVKRRGKERVPAPRMTVAKRYRDWDEFHDGRGTVHHEIQRQRTVVSLLQWAREDYEV